MNRSTPLVLALLLATPSIAWAQRADAGAGKKATPAVKSEEAAPAKKTPPRRRSKVKEQESSGVSPAARSAARRIKSVFIYAADSCQRAGSRCDPTLRNDTEKQFLDACGACNTAARCEEERDKVLAGTARASRDPCAP
jgi:hypothetical protein